MNFNDIKLVIFDMDGLMFDTEKLYVKMWPEAAINFGYDISEDFVKSSIGLNIEAGCEHFKKQFGQDFPYHEIRAERVKAMIALVKQNGIPIKNGLCELVLYLHGINVKMVVATSSERSKTEIYIKSSGLFDYFDFIVCGDEISQSKPNPEIFLKAAEKAGIPIEQCLVLEDSENGINAAFNAKMKCIMVPDLIAPNEELVKKSTMICSSLSEVSENFKIEKNI